MTLRRPLDPADALRGAGSERGGGERGGFRAWRGGSVAGVSRERRSGDAAGG